MKQITSLCLILAVSVLIGIGAFSIIPAEATAGGTPDCGDNEDVACARHLKSCIWEGGTCNNLYEVTWYGGMDYPACDLCELPPYCASSCTPD